MPVAEYQKRLEQARTRLAVADADHKRLAGLRLLLFLVFAAMVWAVSTASVWPWFLLLCPAAFLYLVARQARAARVRRFAERSMQYYERGLDRLNDRWMGKGESGERFRSATHPYGDDLDLFGAGSLFELLSTARTRAGEKQLAEWLLHPAEKSEILARQAAIEELRERVDLREELAAVGEDFRTGVQPEALKAWGTAPLLELASWRRPVAMALSIVAGLLIAAYFLTGLGSAPLRLALLGIGILEAFYSFPLRVPVAAIASAVEQPAHDLDLLSQTLACFEKERFESPKLATLRARLNVEGKPASRRVAELQRLVDLLHSRDNVVVRMLGPLVLWTTQVAFAIEKWRAQSGASAGLWIEAIGELEALSALAGYAYEHPADPFPEVMDGAARFEGEQLGHPLLPNGAFVRNDLTLGPERTLLVISGSNMSGKSTYLRTIGVAAVMALAGAPVRARRLQIATVAIGASIRVSDSLQGGTSRFYAEITRLREIVRLAGERPTLFLLDELLNGTNSHDRGIGAAGVVRGLLARGAVGLVTTHDLALTAMGDENQHFEDELKDGQITFDYRIRPGVVEKSNALELMRAVGLDV